MTRMKHRLDLQQTSGVIAQAAPKAPSVPNTKEICMAKLTVLRFGSYQ